MACLKCELEPVATFDNEPLCAEHVEQWVDVTTRHAPIQPVRAWENDKMPSQSGLHSHTPRHYK